MIDQKHIEAIAYSLQADPRIVKIIAETAWAVSRREYRKELRQRVESLAENCSANTGYGRGQRVFAKKVCEELTR